MRRSGRSVSLYLAPRMSRASTSKSTQIKSNFQRLKRFSLKMMSPPAVTQTVTKKRRKMRHKRSRKRKPSLSKTWMKI